MFAQITKPQDLAAGYAKLATMTANTQRTASRPAPAPRTSAGKPQRAELVGSKASAKLDATGKIEEITGSEVGDLPDLIDNSSSMKALTTRMGPKEMARLNERMGFALSGNLAADGSQKIGEL